MKTTYILLFIGLIFGCNHKQLDTFKEVEFLEKVTFSLDSVTPNYFIGMEVLKDGDKDYLTFLNSLTNTINNYNLLDTKLDRKLSFHVGETDIRR